ncbi:hypothetical protein AX14_004071 [Amanita brunnescens Koide BX004]|nr:hypothetical protein AX14_004071 [Amanita brunnescens Koide BX004]
MTSSHVEILHWGKEPEPGLFYDEKGGCKDASPPSSTAAFLGFTELRPQMADEFCLRVYRHHYTHSENPGAPAALIDPDRYVVVDISIYKRRLPLQHESVVFHLQVPGDHEPEDVYILADRNIDAALLSLLSQSQLQKLTADTAYFLQTAEPPGHLYGSLIWTMTMPVPSRTFNFRFNLAQLATLLSVVSNADRQYNVMNNCYWFTRMVRELVIRIINAALVVSAQPQEIVPLPVDHSRYLWRTGCFLGLFHLDGYSDDLAQNAYTKYVNKYQNFLNKVTLAF